MKIKIPSEIEIYIHDISDETDPIFKEYGFDIKRDIKKNKLSERDIQRILLDITEFLNNVPIVVALYATTGNQFIAMKMRVKDDNKGKRGGIRVILLLIFDVALHVIPVHLYFKSGKNAKKDLTATEQNRLRNLLDELSKSEN